MKKETVKIKGKTVLVGGGIIMLLGVGIWFFRKKRKAKNSDNLSLASASFASGVGRSFRCRYSDKSFPLKFGTCGNNVKRLQSFLNRKGVSLTVDGKFGSKTEAAAGKILGSKMVSAGKFNEIN